MSLAIFLTLASALICYCVRARQNYVILKSQVGFEYGRNQFLTKRVRWKILKRAILWGVPACVYYLIERSWRRQSRKLAKLADRETSGRRKSAQGSAPFDV